MCQHAAVALGFVCRYVPDPIQEWRWCHVEVLDSDNDDDNAPPAPRCVADADPDVGPWGVQQNPLSHDAFDAAADRATFPVRNTPARCGFATEMRIIATQ